MTSMELKARIDSFFTSYFESSTQNGADKLLAIQKLFEQIRDLFHLDMVFLQENHDYLYAFHYSCVSVKEGVSPTRMGELCLKLSDFEKLNRMAKKGEVSENAVIDIGDPDSVLFYGFSIGEVYCGRVGFRSLKKKEWSELERKVMYRLGECLRDFVIARSNSNYEVSHTILTAHTLDRAVGGYYIDLVNARYHRFYLAPQFQNIVPEWGNYNDMLDDWKQRFDIGQEQTERIIGNINIEALRKNLTDHMKVVVEVPFNPNGRVYWARMSFRPLHKDDAGNVLSAILVETEITDAIAKEHRSEFIIDSLQKNYYVILSIDLEMDRYVTIKSVYDHIDKAFGDVGIYDEDNVKIATAVVHPDFREDYLNFVNRKRLIENIKNKFGNKRFSYKRKNGNEYIWSCMDIVPQEGFGESHYRVLAYMSNISEEQAKQAENQTMVNSLSNIYFAVYNVNIENDTFEIVKAPESAEFRLIMRDLIDKGYSAKEGFEKVIEQQINPEYRSLMYHFVNIDTLSQRIGSKSSISVEYMRTDIGWCRGVFIPIKWSQEGVLLRALYAETNINEEKMNREKLHNVQRQLVQERNLGRQLSYKAEHDPLTGALNRAGLDRLLVAMENMGNAMGLAIVDVDLFKGINDTYGHKVGDSVLIQVATLLKNSFRGSDFVARLGGDEFCVLMNNIDSSHQETVVEKFKHINEVLLQPTKELPPVSLSVGVAFSENGNYSGLFNMADKALYQVKKSTRGNCMVYAAEHENIMQEIMPVASDTALLMDQHFIIASSFAGMWRIEIPEEGERRLYADKGAQEMMSISANMSPEACYKYWMDGIEPEYQPVLHDALLNMIQTGPTEILYMWNHPLYGKMKIRVSGSHNPNFKGGQCFCGVVQNVTNLHAVGVKDNASIMIKAISSIFNFIYYIDLQAKTFVSFKNLKDAEGVTSKEGDLDKAVGEFLSFFVAPDSEEAMQEFLNPMTVNERLLDKNSLHCEYKNLVMNCWCLATMIVAERDSDGNVTKIMIGSSSIDGEKRKELEQQEILKSLYDRYQLICRIHLYDDHYHAIANDHRLEQIINKGMASSASFASIVDKFVDPTYKSSVLRFLDTTTMDDRLRRVDSISMEFKEKEFGWCIMEIVACAWDELGRITDVLVIIRTIQNENMDNNQILTRGYDSLTGLRNRENFLAEANRRRADNRPMGYMLIDIDNFKEIKECYGAEIGNAVLLKCATILRSESLHNAIGCHVDADQFAVFIKNFNASRVKELVKYADTINARFRDTQDGLPAFTASVGISFSEAGYKDDLYRHAYEAILPLKQFGGNGYRVYDETVISNKHLSYDDWRRIKEYNEPILRLIENEMNDYAFFAEVDLEQDSYQFLISHELPLFALSITGTYSDMVEYARRTTSYNCRVDENILTADRLQESFGQGRKYLTKEYQHRQSKKWYAMKVFCLERKEDKVKRLLLGWRDITEEKQRLSGDAVSGAQLFETFLHRAPHFLREDNKTDYDILYFNFKEFKNINTVLGFAHGDKVLRRFTERLRDSSLKPVIIARESGDRFYALVEHKNINTYDLADLCQMKEVSGDQVVIMRLHCGVYHVEHEESNIRHMCDKARAASNGVLNEFAKPFAFYNSEEDSRQVHKYEMLHNVEEALEKGEFKVYYQPIFDAKTHEVVSAESLIRWQQPGKGLVPPGSFIPMLEETGYISLVDMFVFSDVKNLLEQRALTNKSNVPVAINLSRMDMLNDDMLYRLRHHVENLLVDHNLLRFEITESSYIDISDSGKDFMERMRELGIGLAVDDFGVGYSSLSTLVGQRFDIIKLDMSYVQQIGINEKAGLVIQTVIKMAHDMGSKTIAEGVETKSQLDFLAENGCDYIQGYYFSRPLPEDEFVKLLDQVF